MKRFRSQKEAKVKVDKVSVSMIRFLIEGYYAFILAPRLLGAILVSGCFILGYFGGRTLPKACRILPLSIWGIYAS